jgi:hypothetical protein
MPLASTLSGVDPRSYGQAKDIIMEGFVERKNIASFTKQLKTESDSVKRAILQALLAAEEAKLAGKVAPGRPTDIDLGYGY